MLKKIIVIMLLTLTAFTISINDCAINSSITQPTAKTLSKVTSYQKVLSNVFQLQIPKEWITTTFFHEDIFFRTPDDKNPHFVPDQTEGIGGIVIKRLKNNVPGVVPLNTEIIIKLMMTNHLEINSKKELKGFFTEAYLLNVTMNAPAGQGGCFIGNWNYIVFIDRQRSTDDQVIAYALFLNTKYASEQQAINIAKTIKIR